MPVVDLGNDMFRFEPRIQHRGPCLPTGPDAWSAEDYANETMLFSADWDFAHKNGGPMTKYAMAALEKHGNLTHEAAASPDLNVIIDTRVHMLMPGMLPAIGGWHCDAMPRPGGPYGDQPNPRLYDPRVAHYTVTVSQSETSRTEFLAEPVTVSLPPGERVWATVHQKIQEEPRNTILMEHGSLARFDLGSPHRASITTTAGWRFFFRASLYKSTPRNQIRRQVQVYIPHEGHGW